MLQQPLVSTLVFAHMGVGLVSAMHYMHKEVTSVPKPLRQGGILRADAKRVDTRNHAAGNGGDEHRGVFTIAAASIVHQREQAMTTPSRPFGGRAIAIDERQQHSAPKKARPHNSGQAVFKGEMKCSA
jgi:hypothetical protein